MSDEIDAPEAAESTGPDSFGAESAEPTVAEKAEATLDSAIEKMLGPDEDDEPAPKQKLSKGAQALLDSDDEEADEEDEPDLDDEEETEASRDEAEEDEETEDDEDEDMALHRAYTTLHDKLKVPASVLKSMPKAKLIAWAERVGAETAEAHESPSKTEQGRETPVVAKEDGKAASAWADHRRGIAEKLGIDEESADAFKGLFDTNAALQARLDAIERRDVQRDGQATIDREMRRLVGQYGRALKGESEMKEAILDKASTIVAGLKARGEKVNVREAFDEAARIKLGDPKRADLAQKRRNGVSTPPERVGTGRTAPLDEDDYWSRGVDLALANKGKDAIAALRPPRDLKPTRRL